MEKMKKFAALFLALCMIFALAVPASAANDKAVKVWVAENVVEFTKAQIAEIVKMKAADLNASDPEAAGRIIAGTARSMGIEVVD